ncbi:hypothetical protein DSO57_1019349 [Entomophthora muscae]|uniref:Uncharacterized protein n=2 Tax=Entomophthora muscae TaxID=34485 RepID=A0ACC2RN72_9FUNG|nr:hypothetical protein DSO57_1003889 [Entomophthora muscae]KAJ9069349.1 hypothetical protein DSO57_1019349 [Entomophthora muscae]
MVKLGWIALVGGVVGHSWLDCIGFDIPYHGGPQFFSNDFYKYCAGFGRGYPGRENRDINTIYTVAVVGRGKPNPETTRVCGAVGSTMQYSSRFPMLKTKAGTRLKFWYQLDNHRENTMVHIIGSNQPWRQISTYADQLRAGDVFAYPFTQNCINLSNDNSWCTAIWTLPSYMPPGIYSYVWNWRMDSTAEGEEYNTCFDIEILP